MRNEFCTLFDVNYLPRGLVLYHSLAEHCDEFRLRVYCVDAESKQILDRLALPHLETIGFDELEHDDPELLAIKPTRTRVEYCWTATPAICLNALQRDPELEQITYLDADLMFYADPAPIFDELGDDSVLIVPHRYAPRWAEWEEASGIYNVQFLTFKRDARGLEALEWWHDRCIEWCYFRFEDGKMGDQKYLDDWPERFDGVHVLQHPGGGLAPWNVESYTLTGTADAPVVDGIPLVFFHYHSLKLHRGMLAPLRRRGLLRGDFRAGPHGFVWTTSYPAPARERELIWNPYLRVLGHAYDEARRVEPSFDAGFVRPDPASAARRTAGTLLGRARRARSAVEVQLRRHRGSWKSPAVATQMRELTDEQLKHPEAVAPLRTFLEAMKALVSGFPLPEPARFLDFGCGVGHYSDLLQARFPGRFVYTGCDYSPDMIATAQATRPGRTFLVNDLLANRLDLGAFDVICASALIDVVADYEQGLDLLLGAEAPYVLLHRQRVTDGPSRVEVTDGYGGQRTYASYVNRGDLERVAARHSRTVACSFVVEGDIETFLLPRAEAA
jgi:SAM-dependent methyltransferase